MTTFRSFPRLPLAAVLMAGVLSGRAAAEAPLASLAVYPPDVNLETARDRQSFVVQATYADGITRDVTDRAKVTLADASLAKIEKNVLYPAKDGQTQMTVEFGGKSVALPVKVVQAGTDRPVSFKLDVMPIFMRAGCNSGSCHGAARGKDGFMLSLFGYDPDRPEGGVP